MRVETKHFVSGLGTRFVEGCGVYVGMLVSCSCDFRHPGLGLKLGFSCGDREDFIIGEG